MAELSVTEVLLDPLFMDAVTVIRRAETVGDDGLSVITEQRIPIMASIQSNSENMDFQPDMSRVHGTWEVITTFPLCVETPTNAPDIVLWRGMEHIVTSIGRFGNFANGAGHYEGVMEIKPVTTTLGPP